MKNDSKREQNSKNNLRKKFYLNLLKTISSFSGKMAKDPTVVGLLNECFVVDKKYEKLCELLMKKYEENGSIKVNFVYFIILISISCMVSSVSLEAENDLSINELVNSGIKSSVSEDTSLSTEVKINSLLDQRGKLRNAALEIKRENNRIAMYENYLIEYSNYYHLNSEKVIGIARTTTNNYQDFTDIINHEEYNLTIPEAACMLFVYHLNKNELSKDLSEFNLTIEDLITTNEIETTPHDNLDELYLSNGQKYSEFYGKICDFFCINDKSLALSASFIEIGKTGSYSSNNRNNVRGMKSRSGEWSEFPTLEAGIIDSCGNWASGYNDYSIDTIQDLACYHISGKTTLPKIEETDDEETKKKKEELIDEIMRWESLTSDFYYEICENYDFYFSPTEETEVTMLVLTK